MQIMGDAIPFGNHPTDTIELLAAYPNVFCRRERKLAKILGFPISGFFFSQKSPPKQKSPQYCFSPMENTHFSLKKKSCNATVKSICSFGQGTFLTV